jgi:arginine-glutamic acid dipeptide repeat-containing protein
MRLLNFVGADPLSAAGSSNAQGAPQAALGPPPSLAPPPPSLPAHPMSGGMVNHPLIAAAREQERVYLDMLSRPPYSTDPIMAQQVYRCTVL